MCEKTRRKKTGLAQFLECNGIKPTGDRAKDMELARKIMPPPYKSPWTTGKTS